MRKFALLATPVLAIMLSAPAAAFEDDIKARIKAAEAELADLKRLDALNSEIAVLKQKTASGTPTPTPTPPAVVAKPLAGASTTDVADAAQAGAKAGTQQALADLDAPTQKFGGIDFGIGFAFTYDLGNKDRIKKAILDSDRVVRVTEQENLRARIVLESHYFFTPEGDLIFGLNNGKTEKQWGFGPFIALQPGTDNVIDAIGGGLMLGLKRKHTGLEKATATSNDSFNIGIGVMYDLNAQVLGEGIARNAKLPAADTDIRYLKTSQSGLMIMSSYSF
ncbi:hypothetical protein [Sphingomonas sp. RS2018]